MRALRSNLILATLATFSLAFFGCKTQRKASVSSSGIASVEKKEIESKPYVNTIKSNYVLNDSSTVTVFMKIDLKNIAIGDNIAALNDIFRTSWTIQPDFGIREKLASERINFDNENTEIKDGFYFLKFTIPKLQEHESVILVLELIDIKGSRKFTNETYIDFSGKRVNHLYGLYVDGDEHPSFETTIPVGQVVTVKSIYGGGGKLYLKKFDWNSQPALSPMSTSKRNELSQIDISWVKEIKDGEKVAFTEEGNYSLSKDSLSLDNSFGFLVVDKYFPRIVDADELKGPLTYMSTNEEIQFFRDSLPSKDILDLYFLKLTEGNQAQAKQIIKSFYRRIAKTNELFSSYKAGWKTDQGMVYAIIGAPSSVQRNGKREVWLYNQGQSLNPIYFTFYRKSNELSDQNFELVRYPEYGAYWYPFVEAWRTGSVLE